ncbi:MAG: hypothetical protein AAF621_02350, partial [Pseudomonadota bacterium]
ETIASSDLGAMFIDLGLDAEEAQELASYFQETSGENVTYDEIVDLLDDDNDGRIDKNEVKAELGVARAYEIQSGKIDYSFNDEVSREFEAITIGSGATTFEFNINDEIEDELSKYIDDNGALSTDEFVGLVEAYEKADFLDRGKPASLISLTLLAIGLEEDDVAYVMNEIKKGNRGEITSSDLIEIAKEKNKKI